MKRRTFRLMAAALLVLVMFTAVAAETCPHGVEAGGCPFCDPTLVESMGFCHGHGVPEAYCTRCNPGVIPAFKALGDWCAGHDLPESQCLICNPPPDDMEEAPEAPETVPIVRATEPPRSLRSPSVTCRTDTLSIRFPSPETARTAGLEYERVERRHVPQTLTCTAEIAFDGNRYVRLASRAPGVVSDVRADLGKVLSEGDLLATVESADLGSAKAEYLRARGLVSLREKNHAREQKLFASRTGNERDLQEAETNLAESRIALARSRQRLANLGLTDPTIRGIAETGDNSSRLPLTAPFAGVVVERDAVIGEVVDTKRPLFTLTDNTRMWAMLDVYEGDILKVRIGQPVVVEVEGLPGERHGGPITWISPRVDRRTRTLKVRVEVENPEGILRAGMFVKAIIRIRESEPALTVPRSALQWEGCCNVVFLKRSDTFFQPRKVRLGYETDRFFVVEEGLAEGDEVVTTGSFLLKTEILKGSIGAGCCEVTPGK